MVRYTQIINFMTLEANFFSPILLVQLIYKATWLLVVAIPAIRNDQPYPIGMAIFFLTWVSVLPFIIPWAAWTN
jgi:hypothetical protein